MSYSKKSRLPIALIARLAALALFLSTVEYLIPKPLPFMRLGLANLPLMVALPLLDPVSFLVLVLLKVAGQALVNGTLFSYIAIFSLFGTFSSALVMFLIFRSGKRLFSYVGISMAGAMASNSVQLLLSYYLIFGSSILLIAPAFLAMGLFSSILLGLFVQRFTERSAWYAQLGSKSFGKDFEDVRTVQPEALRRVYLGMIMLPLFLLQEALPVKGIMTLLFILLAVMHGRRFRPLPPAVMLLTVTGANLLQKNGEVLVSVGSFDVTWGALSIGLSKALTLIGMIYLSSYMVSARPDLPGALGRLLSLQLYYFERVTEAFKTHTGRTLLERLDRVLFSLDEQVPDPAGRTKEPSRAASTLSFVLVLSLFVVLAVYGFIAV